MKNCFNKCTCIPDCIGTLTMTGKLKQILHIHPADTTAVHDIGLYIVIFIVSTVTACTTGLKVLLIHPDCTSTT